MEQFKKGQKVMCKKDVFHATEHHILYAKGKMYKCIDGDCIIDDFNESRAWQQWTDLFNKFFILI